MVQIANRWRGGRAADDDLISRVCSPSPFARAGG